MISATEAVNTLIYYNKGKYTNTASWTCVSEFTDSYTVTRGEFILDPAVSNTKQCSQTWVAASIAHLPKTPN